MVEENNKRSWITEGLIISSIPGLAYLIAFAYEFGYSRFYSIPVEFISPNLTTIFIVLAGLLYIMVLPLVVANGLYTLLPKNKLLSGKMSGIFPLIIMFLVLFSLYGVKWREWIGVAGGLILLIFVLFVFPLLSQRKVKGYTNKLVAQDNFSRQNKSLLHEASLHLGSTGAYIYMFLWFSIMLSYNAGRSAAINQENFLTLSAEKVVLRIYGDNLICASYSKADNTVLKSFVVMKASEQPQPTLTLEKIGPLKSK